MNRTRIEWCDYTWNPVTGCLHGCVYCYARKMARRFYPPEVGFKPHLWRERLQEPELLKKPARIFTCSMADLCGEWVPEEWINAVLETVRNCPRHTFIFLTKNPKRLKEFNPWPGNAWVGATATVQEEYEKMTPHLSVVEAAVRFISFEPLLGPISLRLDPGHLSWAVIGAMTGPKAVKPELGWIERLIDRCKLLDIPVFAKANLDWPEDIQEWPG